MRHLIKPSHFIILFVASVLSFSCADDNDEENLVTTTDYKAHLSNIAGNVIHATYADLATKADELFSQATAFKNDATVSNLDKTKEAWRAARQPWEQSEGFLFGPVDFQGIDPAIDSWPVNIVNMDALLADSENTPSITEAILDEQTNEAKGFHLIEYLLWGVDGSKELADFTPRELEYLVAACENLKSKTSLLDTAWSSTGGNYVANFVNAGQSSSVYPSQKSALENILDGLITIADEVANGKIENPLNGENGTGTDPSLEESRFSHNSKLDFSNNIKSILNVYIGKFTVDGLGISDIVKNTDEALDTQLKREITAAIEAIEAIPGTFTDAIVNNRPAVENAQTSVRVLQKTLESNLKQLISNL